MTLTPRNTLALRNTLGWVLGIVLVAGCTQMDRWENPDVPKGRWASDEAACNRSAITQVEKDYDRQQRSFGNDRLADDRARLGRGDYHGVKTRAARLDRYEAGRRRARLLGDCMIERGYQRAGAAGK